MKLRWPLLLMMVTLAGCARGQLRDHVWSDRDTRFRIGPIAPAWERVRGGDGDLEFYDPSSGGVVLASARCHGEIDAPLRVLRNTELIGLDHRQILSEEEASLAGRAALHSRVRAQLDGAPVELDAWVLKKDGCVYDLVYAAPPARFAAGALAFSHFVAGFDVP